MVRYALLGLLREQRDYGYRLKRRFDERVGPIWHLNVGQVYQTLRALLRAGLVNEVEGEPSSDPAPGRRVFELTAKGQRVLDRWLQRAPGRLRPVRDEILIRLLLLDPSRRDLTLARLAEQEALHRRELARLTAQRSTTGGVGAGAPLRELGLEAAVLHTDAHLRWLACCRDWLLSQQGHGVRPSAPPTPASLG